MKQSLLDDVKAQSVPVTAAKNFLGKGALLSSGQEVKTHFTVTTRASLSPPGSPVEGQKVLLPATGTLTAEFAAFSNNSIASYENATWVEIVPDEGWRADVLDEDITIRFGGSTWRFAYQSVRDGATIPNATAVPDVVHQGRYTMPADGTALDGLVGLNEGEWVEFIAAAVDGTLNDGTDVSGTPGAVPFELENDANFRIPADSVVVYKVTRVGATLRVAGGGESSGLRNVDSFADLPALPGLRDNDSVHQKGYYTPGDGGSARMIYRSPSQNLAVSSGSNTFTPPAGNGGYYSISHASGASGQIDTCNLANMSGNEVFYTELQTITDTLNIKGANLQIDNIKAHTNESAPAGNDNDLVLNGADNIIKWQVNSDATEVVAILFPVNDYSISQGPANIGKFFRDRDGIAKSNEFGLKPNAGADVDQGDKLQEFFLLLNDPLCAQLDFMPGKYAPSTPRIIYLNTTGTSTGKGIGGDVQAGVKQMRIRGTGFGDHQGAAGPGVELDNIYFVSGDLNFDPQSGNYITHIVYEGIQWRGAVCLMGHQLNWGMKHCRIVPRDHSGLVSGATILGDGTAADAQQEGLFMWKCHAGILEELSIGPNSQAGFGGAFLEGCNNMNLVSCDINYQESKVALTLGSRIAPAMPAATIADCRGLTALGCQFESAQDVPAVDIDYASACRFIQTEIGTEFETVNGAPPNSVGIRIGHNNGSNADNARSITIEGGRLIDKDHSGPSVAKPLAGTTAIDIDYATDVVINGVEFEKWGTAVKTSANCPSAQIGENFYRNCTALTNIDSATQPVSRGKTRFRDDTDVTKVAIERTATKAGQLAWTDTDGGRFVQMQSDTADVFEISARKGKEGAVGARMGLDPQNDRAFFRQKTLDLIDNDEFHVRVTTIAGSVWGGLQRLVSNSFRLYSNLTAGGGIGAVFEADGPNGVSRVEATNDVVINAGKDSGTAAKIDLRGKDSANANAARVRIDGATGDVIIDVTGTLQFTGVKAGADATAAGATTSGEVYRDTDNDQLKMVP